ncbi:MAG: cisplatin damage response ATP-dependent DNA ligase [Rhodospirillaceae bacterium]|nr:cisplatin damage response ATP-dependent DNA ligase [Rhodospirillaceae bacterium]
MKDFAALLDRLLYTPSRNGKLRLLADYFQRVPDPDRGWALAALTSNLDFPNAKAGVVRDLARAQTDEVFFALSYDYVGDLAETASLLWQGRKDVSPVRLSAVVETLQRVGKTEVRGLVSGWLDGLDATGRWALLKLITGGMRIGVSARLARVALAQSFDVDVGEIEEIWHGVKPPYTDLFAWLADGAKKPDVSNRPTFRPFMLAHPLDDHDVFDLDDWFLEWKWDGIRTQLVSRSGERRLYSRTGDDISGAFPDVLKAISFDGVLDGELLVRNLENPDSTDPASFNVLQQRLNRRNVSTKMLAEHPAYVIAYDILFDGSEDLRTLPLAGRRQRLEAFVCRHAHPDISLSALLPVDRWEGVAKLQAEARRLGREGLMLKRRDSIYEPGRKIGQWYKWKRDPLLADAVLMYAQRGHGKRSSFYSDYTFGVWRDGELVPVGKAYSGFTDEELTLLDKWVRNNTLNRFGPVREVEKRLVFEVAFDSIHASNRHKSGLAMRFPRISRIHWDKAAEEADEIGTLKVMVDN